MSWETQGSPSSSASPFRSRATHRLSKYSRNEPHSFLTFHFCRLTFRYAPPSQFPTRIVLTMPSQKAIVMALMSFDGCEKRAVRENGETVEREFLRYRCPKPSCTKSVVELKKAASRIRTRISVAVMAVVSHWMSRKLCSTKCATRQKQLQTPVEARLPTIFKSPQFPSTRMPCTDTPCSSL